MNVLIVEDNVMVAMMLTDELEHAGHNVIGPFSESTTAIEKGTEANPEFAIVDLDLADGPTGASVANHLSRKGSCFVLIASGQLAETEQDYGSARCAIGKPYDPEDILAIATGVAVATSCWVVCSVSVVAVALISTGVSVALAVGTTCGTDPR